MRATYMPRRGAASPREKLQGGRAGAKVLFEGSSPDEIALVKFAYQSQMKLTERDRTYVRMVNASGTSEYYDILANFPFSSQSKKMSVLLRQRETGTIIYYVKGAEVVMERTIRPAHRMLLLEYSEQLAVEGLRALVFAQKVLTEDELE